MKGIPFPIVDVTGKDHVNCPRCNLVIEIPLRVIGMRELKHMREIQVFAEWRKSVTSDGSWMINVRILACPKCGTPIIVKDRFTITSERWFK